MKKELDSIKSGRGHVERLFAIADENRKISLTMFFLVVLVVYLGTGLLKIKQNMILSVDIPEKIYYTGNVQIGKDKANPLFYKLWAAYLIKDVIGNYNHRTVKKNYTIVLEALSPDKIGTYGPSIKDKVKKTLTQLISHTYTEGKVLTSGDEYNFTYISKGRGHKSIGEIEEFDEACEYQIEMSVLNFRMKIDRLYVHCVK